ncbi:hypothetical protein [Clostridium perfringens]|nr:hypothetical protein V1680_04395 [Clostridium perfringens]
MKLIMTIVKDLAKEFNSIFFNRIKTVKDLYQNIKIKLTNMINRISS